MTFADLITIMLLTLCCWNLAQLIGLGGQISVTDFLDRFVNSVFVFFAAFIIACVARLIVG
ncbi:hypothetical protein [Acidiphilium acidophilum]|uniref:hypothetical protein n=1 Tax=Acidiphilium acidophilum TaxID=76588 RepID=UPI002E8E658A|nr:hypothetical protein [Acidiphilium acidophilum]